LSVLQGEGCKVKDEDVYTHLAVADEEI